MKRALVFMCHGKVKYSRSHHSLKILKFSLECNLNIVQNKAFRQIDIFLFQDCFNYNKPGCCFTITPEFSHNCTDKRDGRGTWGVTESERLLTGDHFKKKIVQTKMIKVSLSLLTAKMR